jgi:hypothetical protein
MYIPTGLWTRRNIILRVQKEAIDFSPCSKGAEKVAKRSDMSGCYVFGPKNPLANARYAVL